MADAQNDNIPTGWKALFTGAAATNGAIFGSLLGPAGAIGGAVIMGAISLAITSIKVPPDTRPRKTPSQEKISVADGNGLLTLGDRVSNVLAEIERPRGDYWNWADLRNEEASVLPAEVFITDAAAETFLKWKLGYDKSQSAGPGLNLIMATVQAVIGHWGGAATSLAKAVISADGIDRSYKAFLDSDKYFAAYGVVMIVYDAEISSSSLITLRRATATSDLDGHGGEFHHFGGTIVDLREKGH